MVVSCCPALQHFAWTYTTSHKIGLLISQSQLDDKLIGPPKEDQESLSTQIKERSVHLKQQSSGHSARCKTTCSQVSHKQGADFTKLL